ncbi:hypothetical protein [Bacillus albus]|uniref:hypothetical protein n=1 Tax=Bacillus albus TaxID=2026189 RepID=UPI00301498AA
MMNFVLDRLERFDRFLVKYFFPKRYKDELEVFDRLSPIMDVSVYSIILFVFVRDHTFSSLNFISMFCSLLYAIVLISPLLLLKELTIELILNLRMKYRRFKSICIWLAIVLPLWSLPIIFNEVF